MASILSNLGQQWGRLAPRIGSRQRTTEILKTLIIVIPLTLLIWVYAERAQTVTDQIDIPAKIGLTSPDLVATVISPPSLPITVSLDGPKAQIDALKTEINRRLMNNMLLMTMPTSLSREGHQNVNVASALNAEPLFSNSGVTVKDCRPSYMAVDVNLLKTLPVNIIPPTGVDFSIQNVSFDPPHPTVSGPQPDVEALYAPRTVATVDVDTTGQLDALKAPGTHSIMVRLNWPSKHADNIRFSSSTVKMIFDVNSNEKETTLPSIAIVIQKAATQEGKQIIEIKGLPLLQNVKVRGPSNSVDDIVKSIESDDSFKRPKAVLEIGPNETGTSITRNLKLIGIPPEVKVLNDGPFSVEFDIRDASSRPD